MTFPTNTKDGIENFGSDDLPTQDPPKLDDTNLKEGEGKDVELLSTPEPNIIFVGNGEPLTKINDGMSTYVLPSPGEQLITKGDGDNAKVIGKPFYHKNAGNIIRLHRGLYKHFKRKG